MRLLADNPDADVLIAGLSLLAVTLGVGLMTPPLFMAIIGGAFLAGMIFLALRFTTWFCVAWLLIVGLSLEMTLHDLVGAQYFQLTIAAVKGAGLMLALLGMLRWGVRLDLLNPAWAFGAMLITGFAHGLHPGLSVQDSVRSVVGSVAPFIFGFCRVPRRWADAIIRATCWAPVVAVVSDVPLALAGIRPLFVNSGGERLAGLGHPAFLAGVCLPALYACLIELFREARPGLLVLLLTNGLILVLTGARAPFVYGAAVCGLSLLLARSEVFPLRARVRIILGGVAMLPALALATGGLHGLRLFKIGLTDSVDLSGRELLWPRFEAAAMQSPWVGWGVGAGNEVISPHGHIAALMHTWAAHDEYLRIGVEGGALGESLLIGLFVAWVTTHTRRLPAAERLVMRLAFVMLAAHAATDNVLISTPACILFTFAVAVFARTDAAQNEGV